MVCNWMVEKVMNFRRSHVGPGAIGGALDYHKRDGMVG